jgi:hypothetical protein
MGRYQQLHGLKPIGPHRGLADRLFAGTTRRCSTCKGKGLITVAATDSWLPCPDCESIGFVWKCSLDEAKALRNQVLEAFPDAAVDDRPVFSRKKKTTKKKKVAKTPSAADPSPKNHGGFFVSINGITAERLAEMVERLCGKKSTPAEIEECRKELAKMGLPEDSEQAASDRRSGRRGKKR